MEEADFMESPRNCSRTRLLLAVDTFLFREVLAELLSDEMDFEVVGDSDNSVDLLVKAGQLDADCVVLSWPSSGEMPEICSLLLDEYPGLVVIGISPEGDSVYTCRQCISIARHSSHSLEEMLRVVRDSRVGGIRQLFTGLDRATPSLIPVHPPSRM
jgi:DNA-binding NarL/FixJ family response regulator